MSFVFLGLTVAQWIALIPQVLSAVKTAQSIYETIKGSGDASAATQKSVGLLGKAVAALIYGKIGMVVPLPHKMTPDEEKLWMDHATPPELMDR